MSVARVAGHPDYTAAGSGFIPEIWSGKMQVKFYESTCLADITNNDYEGEIKNQGDTVHIRVTPDITIRDYQKGQKLTIEHPESTYLDLSINKGKYWNVVVDDIDAAQSDIKLVNQFSQDAAEQMKITVETDVFGTVYADAATGNYGTTAGLLSGDINLGVLNSPVQITSSNVVDYIIDCGLVLDEQNIPDTGRWMVLPAWMCALIKKSELKDASLTGDPKSPVRTGLIGAVDRFDIYKSNLLTTVAAATDTSGFKGYYALFGTKDAITFASQFTKLDTLRSGETFGDIIRGLKVYGFETVKSESLGVLYCHK